MRLKCQHLFWQLLLILPLYTQGYLIAVGGSNSIEVIGSDGQQIPDLPNFQAKIGGTDPEIGVSLVCDAEKNCYKFDNEEWTKAASMKQARTGAAFVVFDGNLWVTGGYDQNGPLLHTEFYVFDTDEWIEGPSIPFSAYFHSMATLFNEDGNSTSILIIGGLQSDTPTKNCWIFDPITEEFSQTGSLNLIRIQHSCSQIPNTDTVGCIGGYSNELYPAFGDKRLRNMEVFDPQTQSWTLTKHFIPVYDDFIIFGASMVPLENSNIVAGGSSPKYGQLDLIFEYHYQMGFRQLDVFLSEPRMDFVLLPIIFDDLSELAWFDLSMAELPNFLIAGGKNTPLQVSNEAFAINQNETEAKNSLPEPLFGSVTFGNIFCGGKGADFSARKKCFIYQENGAWTAMNEELMKPRFGATSYVFSNGSVWIMGGSGDKSTEIFDGVQWNLGPELPRTLSQHCLVPLENDNFLIIGGYQLESETSKGKHVYLWNQEKWIELNPLNVPRYGHVCGKFALSNGNEIVVVAGGQTGNKMASEIRRLEIYDIDSGTWTLSNQVVPGHPELGVFDAKMATSDFGDLFLFGGEDSFDFYRDIYAYDEHFGFYDVGQVLPEKMSEFILLNND